MIYRWKCVFGLSPYTDTSVVKTNTDLCTSTARTNPFPSVTTGDESNLFLCQVLIPESVNFGMWTKRTMCVLAREPVIYGFYCSHEAQKHIPNKQFFYLFLAEKVQRLPLLGHSYLFPS